MKSPSRTSSAARGIRSGCGSSSAIGIRGITMIVHLNGKLLPIEDAKVSVLDRGFVFGDGVYELVPVYRRQPFRLPQHLTRLQMSLDGIRLANPHTDAEWTSIISELVDRQPHEDQGVYFQVTRGVAKRDHTFP